MARETSPLGYGADKGVPSTLNALGETIST